LSPLQFNLLSRKTKGGIIMKKEKVYTFQDFEDAVDFVHDLKGTFDLTPFELIFPYLEIPWYADYDLKINHSCNDYGMSCFSLKMFVSDGEIQNFNFIWETTSSHVVEIRREVKDNFPTWKTPYPEDMEYCLYLGTDKSHSFYNTIAMVLGIFEEEFVGTTSRGEKIVRRHFRDNSWLVIYPLEEGGFFSECEDTPEKLEHLTTAQREA
jgi:hypothetical protein